MLKGKLLSLKDKILGEAKQKEETKEETKKTKVEAKTTKTNKVK